MTHTASNLNNFHLLSGVCGILSILFYFASAILPGIPDSISRIMGFSFPVLWVITYLGFSSFFSRTSYPGLLKMAITFGVIGSSIACCLIVVQQANIIWHNEAILVSDEQNKEFLIATFKGANRVQAGLDVAFDIFISLSWILLGIVIGKHQSFNKVFGWVGSCIAFSLLVLNLLTFPNSPSSTGLFDLGPVLGAWALVYYIKFCSVVIRTKNAQ